MFVSFFICWITLHLGEFQSVAIGKKKKKQVGRRMPQNNSESYIPQREYPFAAEGVGI